MSLTSQIKDPVSPVTGWMRANLDIAAVDRFVAACNEQLSARRALSVERTDVLLVGHAFDYAFRWQFAGFSPGVALQGARRCRSLASLVGRPEWDTAEAVVEALVRAGNHARNPAIRWRACCVFGWFEAFSRSLSGPPALERHWGQDATRETITGLLRAVPGESSADVASLARHVATDWGDELRAEPRYLNPTFAGSRDVGGADADWIIGATLWDCKVSRQRRPFRAEHIRQALGYVLLDYADAYQIAEIGWYFPRQRLRLRYSLADLLAILCGVAGGGEAACVRLRRSFRDAVRRRA